MFIGINLAIWFNDWNASRNIARDKQFAVLKLKEEIRNNLEELRRAEQLNRQMVEAYNIFTQKWFKDNSSQVLATSAQIRQLEVDYPKFYTLKDSVEMENGKFLYTGQVYIQLELAELTEIAWSTVTTTQVTKTFDYPCLYDLESMYILQRRIRHEFNKSAEALQENEIARLLRILNFIDQLGESLQQDYELMLEKIDDC